MGFRFTLTLWDDAQAELDVLNALSLVSLWRHFFRDHHALVLPDGARRRAFEDLACKEAAVGLGLGLGLGLGQVMLTDRVPL